MRLPTLSATALLLAACTVPPPRPSPSSPPADVPRAVAAAWTSAVSSAPTALASWTNEDGAVQVIAASAEGLALRDGDSGAPIALPPDRQAAAPAGLAVFGDHLFVAGRRRVEVLTLPGLAPVGGIGEGTLLQPGAIWADEGGPDELRVFVADTGGARVARFLAQFDDAGRLQARADDGFATASSPGSLVGDPADGRLLVADGGGVRAYDASGHAGARTLPAAAGLALWSCPDGGGYWLLADARGEVSLFDRASFAARVRFRAAAGQPLGALELHAAGSPRFPAGALYAAAGDAVLAFDLREIATALDLAPDCVQ